MSAPRVLDGRYEVLEELGRGGVGQVLLARDVQLGRRVAIKTLLAEAGAARTRFVEEAQVTGQLAHPNIVPVHALGVEQGALFLVMKVIEGRDLKALARALAAGERVPSREYGLRRRLRLFLKVCEAIAYAHARGVIHRDLKPANLMVTEGDEVLVLDWGLARPVEELSAAPASRVRSSVRELERTRGETLAGSASGELTMDGAVVGTPAYMPPEQADGGVALDVRADVYALGATLYELLVLRPPYQGGTYAVLTQVLEGPPPTPRAAAPELMIPPALESIVLRAMAREREARYPDAAALAADVERFLDGKRPEAHVETLRELAARVVEHHRVAVVSAAAAFLVLNLLLVTAAGLVLRQERGVRAATAEAAAAAAEALAQEEGARRAAETLERTARAERTVGRALRQVLAFEALAASAVPLTAQEGRAAGPLLNDEREAVRRELAAARAEVLELGEQEAAEVGEGAGEADPLARLAAGGAGATFAGFSRELEALAGRVDQSYARTLVSRRPELVAKEAGHLALGPQRPLLLARAALRLERPDEARRQLEGQRLAAGTPEAAAAEALLATLRGAPVEERRAAWDRAVAAAPTWSWLFLRRAECRVLQGDLDGARADYDQAALLYKADPWIYASITRHTFPVFGDHDVFQRIADFVAALAPGNYLPLRLRYLQSVWVHGNPQEPRKQLLELAQEGRLAEHVAQGWISQCALTAGDLDMAEASARRALELAPGDATAQGCLAEVHLRRGAVERALELSASGLERAPQDAGLNGVHGRALLALGRAPQAVPFLERAALPALASDPWRALAEAYLASDDPADWRRGVEAARRGLALDPITTFRQHRRARPLAGDPRPHRVLGHLHRKLADLPRAALHYARAFALSRFPRQAEALGQDHQDALHLGEVHEALRLLPEAVQCYAWAAEDPALKEEAEARIARLRSR